MWETAATGATAPMPARESVSVLDPSSPRMRKGHPGTTCPVPCGMLWVVGCQDPRVFSSPPQLEGRAGIILLLFCLQGLQTPQGGRMGMTALLSRASTSGRITVCRASSSP